jgi:hypothetical protein
MARRPSPVVLLMIVAYALMIVPIVGLGLRLNVQRQIVLMIAPHALNKIVQNALIIAPLVEVIVA